VTRRGMKRRLKNLEEFATPDEVATIGLPDWPLEEQAKNLLEALLVHRCAGTIQACTDREINVLGILHAFYRLPGGVGEHRMASGAVVSLTKDGEGILDVHLSANVSIEDLPEGVRRHVKRIDPEKQPARERRLYELRDYPGKQHLLESQP
jgi:hypothetical protein